MTRQSPNTECFLRSLDTAQGEVQPYDHWLLTAPFTMAVCAALNGLPVDPPTIPDHAGTREANNPTRTFFNPETCARFDVCREVVETLDDPRTRTKIEETCGIDLSHGALRIEYTQDQGDFWLEVHTDIMEKLFTMLIYLTDREDQENLGTDVHDTDRCYLRTVPFRDNTGLIFIPGPESWHGFHERPIAGIRKSLIVNYVVDDWRDRFQLA